MISLVVGRQRLTLKPRQEILKGALVHARVLIMPSISLDVLQLVIELGVYPEMRCKHNETLNEFTKASTQLKTASKTGQGPPKHF